jgi:hypothetical protein
LYENVVCYNDGDYDILGGGDSGYPFYIDSNGANQLFMELLEPPKFTVSISKIETIVHKIDEKYLPEQTGETGGGRKIYYIGSHNFTDPNSNWYVYRDITDQSSRITVDEALAGDYVIAMVDDDDYTKITRMSVPVDAALIDDYVRITVFRGNDAISVYSDGYTVSFE